jgi:hypothetical protein
MVHSHFSEQLSILARGSGLVNGGCGGLSRVRLVRKAVCVTRVSLAPFLSFSRIEQVARTADFAVRVFSVAIIAAVPNSSAVSNLRRPLLSDRYFFIVVRLLRRREKFTEPDFPLLARAFNRARARHPFYLSP